MNVAGIRTCCPLEMKVKPGKIQIHPYFYWSQKVSNHIWMFLRIYFPRMHLPPRKITGPASI